MKKPTVKYAGRFVQKPRKWSDDEIAFVRSNFKSMDYASIGAKLGRPEGSIKAWCGAHGLIRRRHFTPFEKELLRAHWGKQPCRKIAAELGFPIYKVYALANRMGLSRKLPRHGPEFDAFIREHNQHGWTDTEIAAAYSRKLDGRPIDRHSVGRRRAAMGLPDHSCGGGNASSHVRDRVRAKTKEQLQRAGLKELAHVRSLALSQRVERMGWPANVCFREAQILDLIWERGPMTRVQICQALGMPCHKDISRRLMHANEPGGTYTATLMRKGLLMKLPKQFAPGGNIRRKVDLYFIPPHIKKRSVNVA
jgi:hypothetical protein